MDKKNDLYVFKTHLRIFIYDNLELMHREYHSDRKNYFTNGYETAMEQVENFMDDNDKELEGKKVRKKRATLRCYE